MDTLPKHVRNALENVFAKQIEVGERVSIEAGCPKGHNYLGSIIRVRIGKESCIVKVAPENEALRRSIPVNLYFAREIYVYAAALPAMLSLQDERSLPDENRFEVARFLAGSSRETEEFAVFEDLSGGGFVEHRRLREFGVGHLEVIVKTLAKFNALSFALKEEKPRKFRELTARVAGRTEYYDGLDSALRERRNYFLSLVGDDALRSKFAAYLENPIGRLEYFLEAETSDYGVISHGDCWGNNFLFSYENDLVTDMRLLDWQLVRISSPLCDLIYSIYACSDYETRREHLDSLFELYYDTLRNNLSLMGHNVEDCFPREEFDRQLAFFAPFGLIVSIMVLPVYLCDENNIPDFDKQLKDDSEFVFEYSQSCKERLLGVIEEYAQIALPRE